MPHRNHVVGSDKDQRWLPVDEAVDQLMVRYLQAGSKPQTVVVRVAQEVADMERAGHTFTGRTTITLDDVKRIG